MTSPDVGIRARKCFSDLFSSFAVAVFELLLLTLLHMLNLLRLFLVDIFLVRQGTVLKIVS